MDEWVMGRKSFKFQDYTKLKQLKLDSSDPDKSMYTNICTNDATKKSLSTSVEVDFLH
jgi:hypothetical protein